MNNTYYYHHLPYIVKHSYSKYANKYLNLYNRHCQLAMRISYNSCYDKNKRSSQSCLLNCSELENIS